MNKVDVFVKTSVVVPRWMSSTIVFGSVGPLLAAPVMAVVSRM